MTLLGNLFLGIAMLIFFSICSLVYGSHPRSGDAAVGYAWSLILGNLAFIICMAIVMACIGSKGGFSWVGSPGSSRLMLVMGGFVLAMMGNSFFSFGEGLGGLPITLRNILKLAPAILPVLLLVSAAILLNEGLRSQVPAAVYKIPLYLVMAMGIFVLGLLMVANSQNAAAQIQDRRDFKNRIHQNHLDQIDSTDVLKDMVFILVFTDANHAADVRERALTKVKSRSDWQEELVLRLQNGWAPQAFTFLASNEVNDKAMFAEPIQVGVGIQADLIREDIKKCRDAYDLYPDRFTWEVDRVLRTVDKYKGMGVDYRLVVEKMRAALDEPTDFEKPKLHCKTMLDQWLKSR